MDAAPKAGTDWSDLRVRVISAAVMAVIGLVAIWLGGIWFDALVIVVVGVILWEIRMMLDPAAPLAAQLIGGLGAVTVWAAAGLFPVAAIAVLVIAPILGALQFSREGPRFMIYATSVTLAGWGLIGFRSIPEPQAFQVIGLLLGAVIASDILGYFAGRRFGGPKFWPAISPKKTWSGTVAGWVGAAAVGFGFVIFAGAGWMVIPVAVVLAFAGQMGDIAQSALKRRCGVKDSSRLIPGHGGFYDRFDALLGASLAMLLIAALAGSA